MILIDYSIKIKLKNTKLNYKDIYSLFKRYKQRYLYRLYGLVQLPV